MYNKPAANSGGYSGRRGGRARQGVQPSSCGNITNVNQCWGMDGGNSCEWCYWQSGMPGECLDLGTCGWNSCSQAQTPQSCKANTGEAGGGGPAGYCTWCPDFNPGHECQNMSTGGCDTPSHLMPFKKGGRVRQKMRRGGRMRRR